MVGAKKYHPRVSIINCRIVTLVVSYLKSINFIGIHIFFNTEENESVNIFIFLFSFVYIVNDFSYNEIVIFLRRQKEEDKF